VKVVDYKPEQMGYTRRPELDHNGGKAYEGPDGKLHIFPPGQEPRIAKLIPKEAES
jgi:hypothetical protein